MLHIEMEEDRELPRHPLRLFDWGNAAAEVVTEPEGVVMATAFKKKSLQQWEEAKKLRDDPVLDNLDRAAQKAKRKLSSSSGSSSLSSSLGPDSESQTAFRQRSQQSWRKQHQQLVDEAAHIGEGKAAAHTKDGSSEASLAEKLLQKGYGLGSSQDKAGVTQPSAATSSFGGASQSNAVNWSFGGAEQASKPTWSFGSAVKNEQSSPPQGPQAAFRDRLVKFYTKYNPTKLDAVDRTLEAYSGREEELFQKLHERYVADAGLSLKERKTKFITKETDPTVYMDISIAGAPAGRIVMRLLKDEIPLASENFRCLCTGEKGGILTFKGCKFHRIIKNFVVQGGDFTTGDGTGGQSIYRGSPHGDLWGNFKDEKFLPHDDVGLLSMANAGKNTNGSQFFITTKAGLKNLDGKHVVFGEVLEGLDVVDAMQHVKVSKGSSRPLPENEVAVVACGEL
ncbi:Peptidyl-prolyl cis-trans isomerase cyp6 [Phytophthora pseudosyringae]|uniref:peptidylprolyl isomerase n=1 Tax=Phytophthora pseudosyringae TaxID=221518 RepID=A0A8T1W3Z4_9STRA|nr:Peptidyl-prolyl cis-trans isomerase cyp6 [Phytophthora pseudosyringae]